MPNGFAISIALIEGDETNFIGLVKQNDQFIQTENKDSLFEIGSLTKVFTSTLLAHDVITGTIELSKPVHKVFPYKFNNKLKINYLSLANHTSGLYRLPSNIFPLLLQQPNDPYNAYTFELFDSYLQEDIALENNKKDTYSYSNLGAGLLAYALSNASGKPFETRLHEKIFAPNKMLTTRFDQNTSRKGIMPNGEPAENWHFSALKGAGGLVSSTADLTKFIKQQFDASNTILSLTRKETHTISNKLSIGLGWHIIDSGSAEEKYWHNGGTGGFTSSISFRTTNNTGVIILSNISAMHHESKKIDRLCFELLDRLD
jgi:CubicO group peptidase (beta-lactamase class C family)